jgi:hypothetical protein
LTTFAITFAVIFLVNDDITANSASVREMS